MSRNFNWNGRKVLQEVFDRNLKADCPKAAPSPALLSAADLYRLSPDIATKSGNEHFCITFIDYGPLAGA